MAHPFHHAESSVRKHGGHMEDYLPIHQWFDEMDGENVAYFYGLLQDEGGESIKNTLRMQAERTMMKGDVWIPEGMSFL